MTTQSINQIKPLFPFGQTVATPGALEAMQQAGISPLDLLGRHLCGDWGELDADDKAANDAALSDGSRILSAYRFDTVKLWVITEADRSATTILLPEEY